MRVLISLFFLASPTSPSPLAESLYQIISPADDSKSSEGLLHLISPNWPFQPNVFRSPFHQSLVVVNRALVLPIRLSSPPTRVARLVLAWWKRSRYLQVLTPMALTRSRISIHAHDPRELIQTKPHFKLPTSSSTSCSPTATFPPQVPSHSVFKDLKLETRNRPLDHRLKHSTLVSNPTSYPRTRRIVNPQR